MRKIIFVALITFGILVAGCATIKLADYEPTSADEEDVLAFMVECDQAFQNKDMTKYSDCFHENASIMIFQTQPFQRVSKQEFYDNYLIHGRGSFNRQILYSPKIKVEGNTAKVFCKEYGSGAAVDFQVRWDLVKESGRWYVKRYTIF